MPAPTSEHVPDQRENSTSHLLVAGKSDELFIERARYRLFRESLKSADSDPELLATVLDAIDHAGADPLSPEKLTVWLFERLCGTQPLSSQQLRKFLETVALAVRTAIQNTIDQWKDQARVASASTASTIVVAGARPTTEHFCGVPLLPAGINLFKVHTRPDIVEQRLEILRRLEVEDSVGAHWFRLYEFTGAIPEEIAAYYECSLNDVRQRLDVWLGDFHIAVKS